MFQLVRSLRRWNSALVVVSLVIYAGLVFDLIAHPLSGSDGPVIFGDQGTTFRWFAILAGAFDLAVGFFVVRRVPGNRVGPLLILWAAGVSSFSLRNTWSSPVAMGQAYIGLTLFFYGLAFPAWVDLLYRYPTGVVHPPGTAPATCLLVIVMACSGVLGNLALYQRSSRIPAGWFGGGFVEAAEILSRAYDAVTIGVMLTAVLSLGWRFKQAAWRERQQIKWLAWTAGSAVLIAAILIPIIGSQPVQSAAAGAQVLAFVLFLYFQIIPGIAIAIAIIRHQLWDVDIVIRRTLVYSALSAILALVYFGSVLMLESAFRAMAAQTERSPLVIVISTLAIAALFNPLRRRIQDFIDRRFYRQRYNAEQTLAAFSARLRDEIDLEQLCGHLVATVQETIQPVGVSIWLSKAAQTRLAAAAEDNPEQQVVSNRGG